MFRRNVRICLAADTSAMLPYPQTVELDAALGFRQPRRGRPRENAHTLKRKVIAPVILAVGIEVRVSMKRFE